jgi:hypothetical protein
MRYFLYNGTRLTLLLPVITLPIQAGFADCNSQNQIYAPRIYLKFPLTRHKNNKFISKTFENPSNFLEMTQFRNNKFLINSY